MKVAEPSSRLTETEGLIGARRGAVEVAGAISETTGVALAVGTALGSVFGITAAESAGAVADPTADGDPDACGGAPSTPLEGADDSERELSGLRARAITQAPDAVAMSRTPTTTNDAIGARDDPFGAAAIGGRVAAICVVGTR